MISGREGAEVHDQALRVHALERRQILSLEAEVAVGIVLNGRDLIFGDDVHELLAALQRPGTPARVLEIRDDINELDILCRGKNLIQFLHDHAVFIGRNLDKVRLILTEGIDGAQIARALENDHIAGIQEELADKVKALLAAGGQNDLIRVNLDIVFLQHALGNLLSQRSPAVGGTVLQGRGARLIQNGIVSSFDILNGEEFRCGETACEGNDLGLGSDREKLANVGSLDSAHSIRKTDHNKTSCFDIK